MRLPVSTLMQQTYQTLPCQTLFLLYRHISLFSTEELVPTETGCSGGKFKDAECLVKKTLTERRSRQGAEGHQQHQIHRTC